MAGSAQVPCLTHVRRKSPASHMQGARGKGNDAGVGEKKKDDASWLCFWRSFSLLSLVPNASQGEVGRNWSFSIY